MTWELRHRGPDGQGVWVDGPVGLGNRRLAIIDVEGGSQPLSNEDGSVWTTFNGEIYNYRQLRSELAATHAFKTRSDTEVLVHAYEEWGDSFTERLHGFFAFAIWDAGRRRLLLARDRIGKKPLFVAHLADRFLFASELRALLAFWPGRPEVDPQALNDVLAVRHVLGRRTGLRGVEQLLPGERVVFEAGRLTRVRFWQPPVPEPCLTDPEAAVAEFRSLFHQAVECRLESEVPLGVLLSGGIDSTAVLDAMSGQVTGGIKTFTVAFTREAESEARFARLAAQHFGTDHQEILLSERDLLDHVDQLLPRLDMPLGDLSVLPTSLVSQVARQRVTVCLTGDGGDELFGGYTRYARLDALGKRPSPAGLSARVGNAILQRLPRHSRAGSKVARMLKHRCWAPERWYVDSLSCLTPIERAAVLGERALTEIDLEEVERVLLSGLEVNGDLKARVMHLDLEHQLPGMILAKLDRASMLSSLEVRSPFLDHRLIEWSQKLSPDLKVNARGLKWLVRQALAGRVPPELLTRSKMGFGAPIARWFRRELAGYLHDHLDSSQLAQDGYLCQDEVRRMLAAHHRRARNLGEALWVLLALEVWYRSWVRGGDP